MTMHCICGYALHTMNEYHHFCSYIFSTVRTSPLPSLMQHALILVFTYNYSHAHNTCMLLVILHQLQMPATYFSLSTSSSTSYSLSTSYISFGTSQLWHKLFPVYQLQHKLFPVYQLQISGTSPDLPAPAQAILYLPASNISYRYTFLIYQLLHKLIPVYQLQIPYCAFQVAFRDK